MLASVMRLLFAPAKVISRMPRSLAMACSSQSALRSQVWQSPSWSERISSTTVRRALLRPRGVGLHLHALAQPGSRRTA